MEKKEFLEKCNHIIHSSAKNIFDICQNDIELIGDTKIPQENGTITIYEYISNMKKELESILFKDLEIPDSVNSLLNDDDFINKIINEVEKLFTYDNLSSIYGKEIWLIFDLLKSLYVNIFPENKDDIEKIIEVFKEGKKPEINEKDIKPLSDKEVFVMSIFPDMFEKLIFLGNIKFQIETIVHIVKESKGIK